VPEAGIGGVILTNADSGWRVSMAVMRRTLEVVYDGEPEAEEDLRAGIREIEATCGASSGTGRCRPSPPR
jgi:hypothetical protein